MEEKLPTMDRWNHRGGKSQREEEKRIREKIREEKESEERRCGSGRSKSRLAKAAGAAPSG